MSFTHGVNIMSAQQAALKHREAISSFFSNRIDNVKAVSTYVKTLFVGTSKPITKSIATAKRRAK